MRFLLTERLLDEARAFDLRSSCRHCLYYLEREARCAHEWPDEGQARWPLSAPDPATGERPREAAFCKEFELR